MREGLGKGGSDKTKALVSLEKKLDKWLEQRSLAQILDWFNCIETTEVKTARAWATTVGLPNQWPRTGCFWNILGSPPDIVDVLSDFQVTLQSWVLRL